MNNIQLKGEQIKILNLPMNNPILIKGVAGSGKTTVALYRARHLLNSQMTMFSSNRVAIFSYTKSLVAYIESIVPKSTIKNGSLEMMTLHRWAWRYLNERGFWEEFQMATAGQLTDVLHEGLMLAKAKMGHVTILNKPLQFYQEEISWIKGKGVRTLQDYLDTKRAGRGTGDRVTQQDKEVLWWVASHYMTTLEKMHLVEFDDYASKALEYINNEADFQPPYTHIVIDEAQDFSKSQMLLISKLVDSRTNSITVIADAAQRIYKSGFTWKEVGLNVVGGRASELKKNYRNTRQIAEAALSLLEHDANPDEFTVAELSNDKSGSKPIVCGAGTDAAQLEYILTVLKDADLSKKSMVLVHREWEGVYTLKDSIKDLGYEGRVIRSGIGSISGAGLYFCSMHSIKGLEFDKVIICSLHEGVFPHPEGFVDENDEDHINTERRVLYMAMTRAREDLHMCYFGNPSRYLSELNPEKILFLGENHASQK